jgi:hypothetical protein
MVSHWLYELAYLCHEWTNVQASVLLMWILVTQNIEFINRFSSGQIDSLPLSLVTVSVSTTLLRLDAIRGLPQIAKNPQRFLLSGTRKRDELGMSAYLT